MPSSHSGQSDGEEPILVESSESEPEFDCGEDWDSECRVVDVGAVGTVVCGFYSGAAAEVVCAEKAVEKTAVLRPDLGESKFVEQFKENWIGGKESEVGGVAIKTEPFQVGVVQDFLEDADFLLKIREEFNEIEWNQRTLDLYEYYQSKDLQHIELPHLKLLYEFLKNDVMKWVFTPFFVVFVFVFFSLPIYCRCPI